MRIAITGATGHIGTALTPLLLSAGHHLRMLIHKQTGNSPPPKGEQVSGDLLDSTSLAALVWDADAVIHLAAMISFGDDDDGDMPFRVNTEGTRLLADSARRAGVKRFIHISSAIAYEQAPYDELLDETRGLARVKDHGYAHSKALSQVIAMEYNGGDMEVLVLAPTAVMGPYDQAPSLLGKAVIGLYNGNVPALFPGGVDLVDVRDVAAAIVSALTAGAAGKTYLLSGQWASLASLSARVAALHGKKKILPVIPLWLVFASLPFVALWARMIRMPPYFSRQSVYSLIYSNKKIDHSLARVELQFQPRPLTNTIRDTIDWFRLSGQIK